jgi:hypothetical protein
MQRIIALVLLGAALVAQAKPIPFKLVQDFARTHSSNGNAVGVVQWTGQGTGKEVQLGECSLAERAQDVAMAKQCSNCSALKCLRHFHMDPVRCCRAHSTAPGATS